jgi:hypothetical protein
MRFEVLMVVKIQVIIWDVMLCSVVVGYHFTLKVEAVWSSKNIDILPQQNTTRHHIPEDLHLNQRSHSSKFVPQK